MNHMTLNCIIHTGTHRYQEAYRGRTGPHAL